MSRRYFMGLALVGIITLVFVTPHRLAARSHEDVPATPEVEAPAVEAPEAVASTAFTYQGELKKSGNPYTGTCNLRFKLFTLSVGGSQLGSTITLNNVSVSDGLFTVTLDFGNQFNGSERFLETSVQCAGDAAFTDLASRTKVTPAPYSISTSGLRGALVSDAAPAAGDILAFDGTQWAPTALNLRRKYYLTSTQVAGNAATTACAAGYHMANYMEIFAPTYLEYNTVLGYTPADSGSGPPSAVVGWVRTGGPAITNNIPGNANCNAWTSNASNHYGTALALQPQWATASVAVSPWDSVAVACNLTRRVWCVQD